jgi:hypothetical protein
LGLTAPWRVERVELKKAAGAVECELTHRSPWKILELPITKPLPEIDQVIKIDGDLALVIGVRQIDEKRVELVFRPMPGATRQLEQIKKSGGPS